MAMASMAMAPGDRNFYVNFLGQFDSIFFGFWGFFFSIFSSNLGWRLWIYIPSNICQKKKKKIDKFDAFQSTLIRKFHA